jgi:phosphoribosyl 1,2-cyclic phosphate phosphodiesterase
LKITFLGTGTSQGIPVIACDCEVCTSSDPQDTRLRTAAMVTVNGKNIVIDVGPDFRQQMLQNKIVDIDSILITHEHNDHVIGLDDVRPFNFRHQKKMPVYCTLRVMESLKKHFDYAFAENPYPGAPRFELKEIFAGKIFEVAGQSVVPFTVMHGKMPVLGFRFGDLTYITDAKEIDDVAIEKIKGTKILIINALRLEKHHSHFSLDEALAFITLIKPQKAFLVHVSHTMGLAAAINERLPSNVALAYDGLEVVV